MYRFWVERGTPHVMLATYRRQISPTNQLFGVRSFENLFGTCNALRALMVNDCHMFVPHGKVHAPFVAV